MNSYGGVQRRIFQEIMRSIIEIYLQYQINPGQKVKGGGIAGIQVKFWYDIYDIFVWKSKASTEIEAHIAKIINFHHFYIVLNLKIPDFFG